MSANYSASLSSVNKDGGRKDKGNNMSSEQADARVVFLVGAGASVKFGIPHMAGMVQEYMTPGAASPSLIETLNELLEVGVKSDLEEILLAIQTILELPTTPLYDSIFQAVEGPLDREGSTAKQSFEERQERIERLLEHILGWISNTCLKFSRPSAMAVWGNLVKAISERGSTVFTTNYDFAIEVVARLRELTVVDNFTVKPGRPNRMFWDESLRSFDSDGLRIVKLHGSVNWYETEEGGEIERLDLAALTNQEGQDVSRVQIFPTRFKDIYDSHFFTLYKRFLRELDEADVLVVIGHSLRDDYIRAAIRERFRSPEFTLVYIGPSMPDLADFRLTEQQARQIKHVGTKFEDISDSVAYVLEKYGAQQLGLILGKLVTAEKRGEITLSDRLTFMDPGQEYEGTVTIQALAIPPAMLRSEIVPDKAGTGPSQVLEVTDDDGEQPLVVEGIEQITKQIRFRLPDDLGPGKYHVQFKLVQEGEAVVAEKSYVWNIKGPSETEEDGEETAAESEAIDEEEGAEVSPSAEVTVNENLEGSEESPDPTPTPDSS